MFHPRCACGVGHEHATLCFGRGGIGNSPGASLSLLQEGYAAGERVLTLPCAHLFHAACISPWLLQFSCICPICRGSLSPTTAGPPPTAIATHQSSPAAAVAATMPRPSLAAVQCVAAVQCDGAAAAASVSNRMRLRGRCASMPPVLSAVTNWWCWGTAG